MIHDKPKSGSFHRVRSRTSNESENARLRARVAELELERNRLNEASMDLANENIRLKRKLSKLEGMGR